jgi:hypothetical protein
MVEVQEGAEHQRVLIALTNFPTQKRVDHTAAFVRRDVQRTPQALFSERGSTGIAIASVSCGAWHDPHPWLYSHRDGARTSSTCRNNLREIAWTNRNK